MKSRLSFEQTLTHIFWLAMMNQGHGDFNLTQAEWRKSAVIAFEKNNCYPLDNN